MGVGFAKDAESQNKKNRKLLEQQRNKYFKNQTYKATRKSNLIYKPATKEQLKNIRLKLAKQKKKSSTRVLVLIVLLILIIAVLFSL